MVTLFDIRVRALDFKSFRLCLRVVFNHSSSYESVFGQTFGCANFSGSNAFMNYEIDFLLLYVVEYTSSMSTPVADIILFYRLCPFTIKFNYARSEIPLF